MWSFTRQGASLGQDVKATDRKDNNSALPGIYVKILVNKDIKRFICWNVYVYICFDFKEIDIVKLKVIYVCYKIPKNTYELRIAFFVQGHL